MKFLDRNDPIFRKRWVRVASVVVPAIWAVVEFALQNAFWGLLFGALAAYAAYELFFRAGD
ncbi:MAG: hypothetical protein U5N55_01040 [Cypionkella sp.]|nr:hypothetical protein [Cypionkella sp.]